MPTSPWSRTPQAPEKPQLLPLLLPAKLCQNSAPPTSTMLPRRSTPAPSPAPWVLDGARAFRSQPSGGHWVSLRSTNGTQDGVTPTPVGRFDSDRLARPSAPPTANGRPLSQLRGCCWVASWPCGRWALAVNITGTQSCNGTSAGPVFPRPLGECLVQATIDRLGPRALAGPAGTNRTQFGKLLCRGAVVTNVHQMPLLSGGNHLANRTGCADDADGHRPPVLPRSGCAAPTPGTLPPGAAPKTTAARSGLPEGQPGLDGTGLWL